MVAFSNQKELCNGGYTRACRVCRGYPHQTLDNIGRNETELNTREGAWELADTVIARCFGAPHGGFLCRIKVGS